MWATLLRVETPACAWCRETTVGEPRVGVKVLSHFPTEDGSAWEEVELAGGSWVERLARIRSSPGVGDVQVLESTPEHGRVRLRVPSCPLARAVARSGALPRFPFEVRDGADRWLLIAEREAASRFVDDLRDQGLAVEVLSFRAYRPHESLTRRQREMMDAAIQAGYYEVPRRVTLTRLAERLHVAKSTLSETLARAEHHVLEDMSAQA